MSAMDTLLNRIKKLLERGQKKVQCELEELNQKKKELEERTHDTARRVHVIEFETYGRRRD